MFGSLQETFLMVLCMKPETPLLKAQILQLVKRLLANPDPAIR